MPFSSDWIPPTRERLATSSLEDWASYMEANSLTAITSPGMAEYWRACTAAPSPRRRISAAVSTFLVLLILALVLGFILLILWVTAGRVFYRSSMDVSQLESDLVGSTGRRPFSCLNLQCDEWRNTLEEGRSSLKYETQPKEDMWEL